MNRNKNKLYAKILLGCLAGSYFQMFGAAMPVDAQESNPLVVEAKQEGLDLTYEAEFIMDSDLNIVDYELSQFWSDSECEFDDEDKLVEASCSVLGELETYAPVVNGKYYVYVTATEKITDKAVGPEVYFAYDFIEYTAPDDKDPSVSITVSAKDGVLTYGAFVENIDEGTYLLNQAWSDGVTVVGDEPTFTPVSEGDYSVVVCAYDIGSEQKIVCSDESNIYPVRFPVLDKLQFTPLTYNAGERMVFVYKADALTSVVSATFEGGALLIDGALENNVWSIESGVLETAGNYNLNVVVTSEDGFSDSADFNIFVNSSTVVAANSTLSVTKDGVLADYVEVDSGYLDIIFEAHDAFGNRINVEKLSRVDVRLNGELLEGVDEKGEDLYRVKRTALVPSVENLSSNVTVDVFSAECDGILGDKINYCFSKVHSFAIYDTNVKPVENLVYVKRTNASTVRVSGTKLAGYGIKLNSETSAFIVEPNDSTVFSFEMPLAEGSNLASVYSVKSISADLKFYSKPVKITVVKDTTVSAIEWNEPAILLDGENQATLRWTDPSDYDFSHVNIYRSTVPNFVPNERNLIVQTHNPDWTDTNLDAGSSYYYAIEAVDDLGNTSLISSVVASGAILGESATIVATADDILEYQYVGKGTGGQDVIIESEDTEDSTTEETESNGVGGSEEEEPGESLGAKLKEFFNKAKDSASTVFSSVTSNIFVQICVGGILIFVGLMFLISILVWLKEKIVDARLVSLDDDEKEDK